MLNKSLIVTVFVLFGCLFCATSTTYALDYKFPWDWGGNWVWTNGWHLCNGDYTRCAVDIGTDGVFDSLLSPADGIITGICTGDDTIDISITHSDGVLMKYLHLDKQTAGTNLTLNTVIKQGDYLGKLEKGIINDYMGACGYTSGAPNQSESFGHVHWSMPSKTSVVTIDEWKFADYPNNNLTRSGYATKYPGSSIGSTNTVRLRNGILQPSKNIAITAHQQLRIEEPTTVNGAYGDVILNVQ